MADSDSELENDIMMDDDGEKRPKVVKAKRLMERKYIHENADTIVDLADISAMSKITCMSPHTDQFNSMNSQLSMYYYNYFYFTCACSVQTNEREWQ